MKKLIVFTGILFLVFGMAAVTKVSAGDVTALDNLTGPGNTWWSNPLENQETEPGTVIGQTWDLEKFIKTGLMGSGNDLQLQGGYNFYPVGQTWKGGDLFIETGGKPLFGALGPALSLSGPDNGGNTPIFNNFGYNYAVKLTWTDATSGTYQVYKNLDGNSILLSTAYRSGTFPKTNPWELVSGGDTGSSGSFSMTNFTDAAGPLFEGTHYVLTFANLLGLPEFATAKDIWLHYTYQCGNDFIMGQTFGSQVPIPSTLLLLGSGLLGVGLLRFRRKTQG